MTAAVSPRVAPPVAPRLVAGVGTRQPHRVPGSRVRPADRRAPAPRPLGTQCAGAPTRPVRRPDAATFRRRRGIAGVLVGAALAGVVWFFAIVGGNYAAAVAPEPTATSVVHVRAGESLSAVAARVAPTMPQDAVINEIVELNHLRGSALSVGQALVAPVY